jgi:hypothetical protein
VTAAVVDLDERPDGSASTTVPMVPAAMERARVIDGRRALWARGRPVSGGASRSERTLITVRILGCSDLHRERRCARALVQRAGHADIVAVVGDLASVHRGLEDMIRELRAIDRRVLLVPRNNETDDALRHACAGWPSAAVLHGQGTVVGGVTFFGLGGGIPETPWDWSFDLSEAEAERRLTGLPRILEQLSRAPPASLPSCR